MNDRQLSDIRRTNEQMVRLLNTINSNILALHRVALEAVDALKKMQTELTRDIDLDKFVEDLKKVVDANDVELPAVAVMNEDDSITLTKHPEDLGMTVYGVNSDGCLFPWQWRHNLGMDVLPEDVRALHQPHENHPMTEEAFRIYNAGLVSEFVVKTKQEEL